MQSTACSWLRRTTLEARRLQPFLVARLLLIVEESWAAAVARELPEETLRYAHYRLYIRFDPAELWALFPTLCSSLFPAPSPSQPCPAPRADTPEATVPSASLAAAIANLVGDDPEDEDCGDGDADHPEWCEAGEF